MGRLKIQRNLPRMEKGYDKEMEKIPKEVENPEFVYCHDSVEMFNVKTKKLVLI